MIFAFQSHQATPGYEVSYCSRSERLAVLLGMLRLLSENLLCKGRNIF